MENRTGKQCRERYFNHLQPNIKKGNWSDEEDNIIIQLQAQIGNQWSAMTKSLPGRTDNAIKNRWHAIVKAQQLEQETQLSGTNPLMPPPMAMQFPDNQRQFINMTTPFGVSNNVAGFNANGMPMFDQYQLQNQQYGGYPLAMNTQAAVPTAKYMQPNGQQQFQFQQQYQQQYQPNMKNYPNQSNQYNAFPPLFSPQPYMNTFPAGQTNILNKQPIQSKNPDKFQKPASKPNLRIETHAEVKSDQSKLDQSSDSSSQFIDPSVSKTISFDTLTEQMSNSTAPVNKNGNLTLETPSSLEFLSYFFSKEVNENGDGINGLLALADTPHTNYFGNFSNMNNGTKTEKIAERIVHKGIAADGSTRNYVYDNSLSTDEKHDLYDIDDAVTVSSGGSATSAVSGDSASSGDTATSAVSVNDVENTVNANENNRRYSAPITVQSSNSNSVSKDDSLSASTYSNSVTSNLHFKPIVSYNSMNNLSSGNLSDLAPNISHGNFVPGFNPTYNQNIIDAGPDVEYQEKLLQCSFDLEDDGLAFDFAKVSLDLNMDDPNNPNSRAVSVNRFIDTSVSSLDEFDFSLPTPAAYQSLSLQSNIESPAASSDSNSFPYVNLPLSQMGRTPRSPVLMNMKRTKFFN